MARRGATRNRVIGERVTPETADAWLAAWEAQADRLPGHYMWRSLMRRGAKGR